MNFTSTIKRKSDILLITSTGTCLCFGDIFNARLSGFVHTIVHMQSVMDTFVHICSQLWIHLCIYAVSYGYICAYMQSVMDTFGFDNVLLRECNGKSQHLMTPDLLRLIKTTIVGQLYNSLLG